MAQKGYQTTGAVPQSRQYLRFESWADAASRAKDIGVCGFSYIRLAILGSIPNSAGTILATSQHCTICPHIALRTYLSDPS